jgi:hypothetical protein
VRCIYHMSAERWPDKFQRIINKICNGQRGMEQVFVRITLYSTLVQYSSAAVFFSVTSSWKLRPVRSAATSHKLCLRSAHGVWLYPTVKRLTCNVSAQHLHCPSSQSTGGMPVWKCYLYTFIKHKMVFWITCYWSGIVQSVQRLATSWTVWGSNPVCSEIFRTCPVRLWNPPSLL